jgi:hypothetical protein
LIAQQFLSVHKPKYGFTIPIGGSFSGWRGAKASALLSHQEDSACQRFR